MAQRSLLADRREAFPDSAIVASVADAPCPSTHEAKEARPRPMGAGDLLGDLGERRITRAGIFEALFRHCDRVRAATPFTHQPSAGLQAEAGIRCDPASESE